MSFTVQNRKYAYDNPIVGQAAGQETNQAQFFPYTPGTGTAGSQNDGEPVADFERLPTGGSSYARCQLNRERSGNSSPATWGYGQEIP